MHVVGGGGVAEGDTGATARFRGELRQGGTGGGASRTQFVRGVVFAEYLYDLRGGEFQFDSYAHSADFEGTAA